MILTRATRDGIRGPGTVSNGYVVQWVSLVPGRYSPTYIRPEPEGARLIVYLESGLDADGYRNLLAGKYDHQLAVLAAQLPADAILRWDHEMSSPPNDWRVWGQVPPELYVRVWWYVCVQLGSSPTSAAIRPMFWCPSGHKVDVAYWPGSAYVSHVGFTSYELGVRPRTKPRGWGITAPKPMRIPAATLYRKPLAAVRAIAPGVPIIVGETGTLDDDTGDRLPWLRSVRRVKGVDIVVYFDVDMSASEGRSWLLPGTLREEWER